MSSRGRCQAGASWQVVGRAQRDRRLRRGLPLPTSSRRSILTLRPQLSLGCSSPHQGLPLLSSFELSLGPSPLHFTREKKNMKQLNALSPLARRTLAPPPEAPPPRVPSPSLPDPQVSTSRGQPLSCLHSPLGGGSDPGGRCLCPSRRSPGLAHFYSPACL